MPSVKKTNSGKYKATISWMEDNHRKTKSKTHNTETEAWEWARMALQEVNGLSPRQTVFQSRGISFSDYFMDWFRTFKEPHLASNSTTFFKRTHRMIIDYFGDMRIKNISRMAYQNFLNEYGAKYAPSTIRKSNQQIKECVESAIADGLIDKNFTFRTFVKGNRDREKYVEYLNISELQKLVKWLENNLVTKYSKYTNRYMLLTSIYTGMRIGEIEGLTWNDIDFENKIININKTWNVKTKNFASTKNSSSIRVIAVPQHFLDMIKPLKSNHQRLVFATKNGTMAHPNSVNATLKKALKQLGIEKKGFHTHSLRHTHVAFLLSQGIDLYAISKRLGHSEIQTTSRFYAYMIKELEERENLKITTALDSLRTK